MDDERQEDAAPAEAPAQADVVKLGEAMQRIQVDAETGLAVPKSMQDQVAMAAYAVKSGLLPDSIKTTAQAWMVMQRGTELGYPGLAAFDVLYPVNGKVRLTPDGAKGKAQSSGLLVDAKEEVFGEGENMVARVTLWRKGIPTPIVGEFSVQDAKTAKLWGKTGPSGKPSAWVTYPKRMLLARARGFAYGDAFRDVVGGLQVRETYDLDPGEAPSVEAPAHRAAMLPPPIPDPLLDELGGAPFESHAAADAAIAAEESEG